MIFFYLLGLVIAISGLLFIDYRYKLAFFFDAKRTTATLGLAIALFIIWDILGINLGIFYHGGSSFTLPFRLLPEFPIEELFFLFLLTYVALIIYRFVEKRMA